MAQGKSSSSLEEEADVCLGVEKDRPLQTEGSGTRNSNHNYNGNDCG